MSVQESMDRPRVLMNIVRLLPESKGAGGAGRLVMALLAHLPQYVDLRVAIAPHSEYLLQRFPKLAFVTIPGDTNAFLDEHLQWCECYIDPLNGLRPSSIDPDIAVISMVLDLQHMRMPWLFSEAEMAARVAEYTYAIDRSDQLVAISEYERENFREFYGIDRVSVMHLAGFMAEDSATAGPIGAEITDDSRKYLIYPAVPWQHKNHEILIQAIGVLNRRGIQVPVVLTNTGGRSEMRKRLGNIARANGVEALVTLQSYLPEPELLDLFTRSTGMVFPTLYEGFGIPLTDAMALGVPVLTTTTSAVPEICGDAVSYFANPMNAISMADDILLFWEDAEKRAVNKHAGFDQAKNFSSEKMAVSLLSAINQAIANKKARGFKLPPTSRFVPAHFLPISVLIVYADLEPADIAWLVALDDLDAFHRSVFGANVDITVVAELELASDPGLERLFARLPKFILSSSHRKNAVDHAVCDFSGRYDQSDLQLCVRFDQDRLSLYTPDRIALANLALRLHQDADYAVIDPKVVDCTLDPSPTELSGVAHYDVLRRNGSAVFDKIVKRSSVKHGRNGSAEFLSLLCTKLRCLRVPSA